jgi:hypothetical protein
MDADAGKHSVGAPSVGLHASRSVAECFTRRALVEVASSKLQFGRHLESTTKAAARLVLEVSAGWASPPSRALWSGDALLLSIPLLETDYLARWKPTSFSLTQPSLTLHTPSPSPTSRFLSAVDDKPNA